MHCDQIYGALRTVGNRYMLCRATVLAIRKFHRPKVRTIPETISDVFARFGESQSAEQLVMPVEQIAENQVRAA